MNYEGFFAERLASLRNEGRYRIFADLERQVGRFPRALNHRESGVEDVVIWCSNDYLGMGHNDVVLDAMVEATRNSGAGAGGTRNISGTNHYHVLLEEELADLHDKEAALLFTSGWVANMTALATLASQIPGCVVFSDSKNHNSMIEGIRHSRAQKHVFKHNDPADLDRLLGEYGDDVPKLVAFESVYSMDGDISPIPDILDVCEKHNAMSFLDEVHAVGMYGHRGGGVAQREEVMDRVTIVQGTMGKAIGVIGGYIAASANLVDFVRSFGPGFIFTTSLPPSVAAGAAASIRHLKEHDALRQRHQERAATLKRRLQERGIAIMPSVSHIVPVWVGDAALCKEASDKLLTEHGIYVQPINYPTVDRGTERLRFTPTPLHDDALMDHLVEALARVWTDLGLEKAA